MKFNQKIRVKIPTLYSKRKRLVTGNQQYHQVHNNYTLVHKINLSAHNKILF